MNDGKVWGKCLRQKDELGQRSCGGHTLDLIEDSKKAVEVAVKGRVVPGEISLDSISIVGVLKME